MGLVTPYISRTYALRNKSKHQTEGFHLCDGVHCQAFKGAVINNDSILLAAVQTSGYVLTDHNIDLISAVFHSNCGGQTVNSDLVWTHALPYLEGVKDSFCISMPNAHWTKSIPEKKWADYMDRKTDSDSILFLESFTPEKTEYFNAVDGGIKNTEIRKDWKLKSAWFTTCVEGDQVVFYGRGFGHGVGLCQEGAIRMAELGYTYSDILHFYYSDVHLIDLEFLDFFRD